MPPPCAPGVALQLEPAVHVLPHMVWSCAPDGSFEFFNQAWYDYIGMAPGEITGPSLTELQHPDDRAACAAAWQHSLTTGEPYDAECRMRHHSGAFRWHLCRARPERDARGAIVRWWGTHTDIQAQKHAQEDLEALNRRKDEFMAMLAHELRNPLAPISSAAQLLRIAPNEPSRVLRASALIERQVTHMTELVDDLLDISRITRGLVQIESRSVLLQQVVQDALEQTRPHTEAHRHTVKLALAAQPVYVQGDRVRLVQVLTNLLHNSAKFTPNGGCITVGLDSDDHSAHLTVTDNGSGIDAQLIPHVFELFTQAQRSSDRNQGGLGVGLALVKSLVELHGGSVQAHSPGPGRGCRFTVTLPRHLPNTPARKADTAAPTAPAGVKGLRLLIVDDNADAAEMLGDWLQAQGHEVAIQTSPAEALAAARQRPADVYILDIGLPGMDGNELARHLRQDPRNQSASFIALTGYGQAQDLLKSHEAGFDHHFVKPADPIRLAAAIASVRRDAATQGA